MFALLVTATAAAATIGLALRPTGTAAGGSVTIGPELPSLTLAALAWGVAGGVIGALSAGLRGKRTDQEVEEPEEA